jgi:hypothetical protein
MRRTLGLLLCRLSGRTVGNLSNSWLFSIWAFADTGYLIDEIAELRAELDESLWDFDEYIQIDDFDASRFSELQTLSKKAALRIIEAIRRMKLEVPSADLPRRSGSLQTDGPVGDVPPGRQDVHAREQSLPARDERFSVTSVYSTDMNGPTAAMGTQAGPDLGLGSEEGARKGSATGSAQVQEPHDTQAMASPVTALPVLSADDRPPEPALNPWQLQRKSLASPTLPQNLSEEDREAFPRRREVLSPSRKSSESLESRSPAQAVSPSRVGRLDAGVDRMIREVEEATQRLTTNGGESSSASLLPPAGNYDATTRAAHDGLRPGSIPESPILPQRWSQASSAVSYQPSISSDRLAGDRDSLVSPVTTDNRMSTLSMNVGDISPIVGRQAIAPIAEEHPAEQISANFAPLPNSSSRVVQGGLSPGTSEAPIFVSGMNVGGSYFGVPIPVSPEQPGLEPSDRSLHPQWSGQFVDHGLIPVDSDPSLEGIPQRPRREPDCSITVRSSFHQLKGFCRGAQEIMRGGRGVRKLAKPGVSSPSFSLYHSFSGAH